MKIAALITIHVGFNFGSVLQTIASCEMIKRNKCRALVIDYIPQKVTYARYFRSMFSSLSQFVKKALYLPIYILNNYVYRNYLTKYCNLSTSIFDSDNFQEKCPTADFYITGSDQVWNSVHNEGLNARYFFDGIAGKKIAYSSSFGTTTIAESEYDIIKQMLSAYSSISVREDSAKRIVEDMGLKATHLLDPTFMLKSEEWKVFMSKRMIPEPYILVYLPYNVHDKNLIYKTVHRIADENNLKIVTFSWNILNEKYADKTIKFANPGDFLSLMYYADFVITNSFHGTAFSINLNKQFYVYMPTGFGTRILSILKMSNLESRLLKADEIVSLSKIEAKIDYSEVNEILDTERLKSYDFLKNALKA